MNFFKYFLYGALAFSIISCGKDEEDTKPSTPTNVDLTGVYTGEITEAAARMTGDPDVVTVTKISDNKYSMASEEAGATFAEVTVSGKNFTGTPVSGAEFKEMTGSLNDNTLTFKVTRDNDSTISFVGTRPGTGGGGGGGGGGGSKTIVVDGMTIEISVEDCSYDSDLEEYGMVFNGQNPNNSSEGGSVQFSFKSQGSAPAPGSYTLVPHSPGAIGEVTVLMTNTNMTNGGLNAESGSISVSSDNSITIDHIVFDYDPAEAIKVAAKSASGKVYCGMTN